jgi:hypothetical protein
MRRFLLSGALLLALCSGAWAQQNTPPPIGGLSAAGIHLELTEGQTKLIVDTLGQIGCQNVAQLAVCDEAKELRREIARQAKPQVKAK